MRAWRLSTSSSLPRSISSFRLPGSTGDEIATSGRPIAPVAPPQDFHRFLLHREECNSDARGYNSENGKDCVSVSRTRLSVRRHGKALARRTRRRGGCRRGGLGAELRYRSCALRGPERSCGLLKHATGDADRVYRGAGGAWRKRPRSGYVAGHSLGEYSAGGSWKSRFADAVRLVRPGAAIHEDAVAPGVGAMARC